MNAHAFTLELGGRWHGCHGAAPCPVCQPEGRRDQAALALRDGDAGRLLAHCKKGGCAFRDILAAAGVAPGPVTAPDPAEATRRRAEARAELERRAAQAARCWDEAVPIAGTPAERYLRGRGITAPLGEALRFHPECWHGPTARRLPAMVARVEGSDAFAVHRTYLAPDSAGKAPVEPAKAMLGATAGGVVCGFHRLWSAVPRASWAWIPAHRGRPFRDDGRSLRPTGSGVQVSGLGSSLLRPALSLRMLSPASSRRWASWTSLSRMASARVESPMTSCQASTGIWLVTMVAARPWRSSRISIRSRRSGAAIWLRPQSSMISSSARAMVLGVRGSWGCGRSGRRRGRAPAPRRASGCDDRERIDRPGRPCDRGRRAHSA